jgi:hypothetical protein
MNMLRLPIALPPLDFRRFLRCCWLKAKKPPNS